MADATDRFLARLAALEHLVLNAWASDIVLRAQLARQRLQPSAQLILDGLEGAALDVRMPPDERALFFEALRELTQKIRTQVAAIPERPQPES